jgi:hypothetical protein
MMASTDHRPNDEFSVERLIEPEVAVKHRATGHVFTFMVSADGHTFEHEFSIDPNPASNIEPATLVPWARSAAMRFYFPRLPLREVPSSLPLPDQQSSDVAVQIAADRRRQIAALSSQNSEVIGPPADPPLEAGPEDQLPMTVQLEGRSTARSSGAGAIRVDPHPQAGTAPTGVGGVTVLPSPGLTVDATVLPRIELIPQQARAASQFTLDVAGRIDLVPDPPDKALLADPIQRELYEDIRHKALVLSELGHNQLGDLLADVRRFLASVPERIEAVSIIRLWSRGNTLRRRLSAHGVAAASLEPTDPARLTPFVAEKLRDLVETYNVFILGDPTGRELEQARLGPQERDVALAAVNDAIPFVEAVRHSTIATTAAIEALTEQVQAANDAASLPPTVNTDQAVELGLKTGNNFVVELLRRAYAPVRAVTGLTLEDARAGVVGGAAWEAVVRHQELIHFIAENADSLKVLVGRAFENAALVQIIDLIMQGSRLIQ